MAKLDWVGFNPKEKWKYSGHLVGACQLSTASCYIVRKGHKCSSVCVWIRLRCVNDVYFMFTQKKNLLDALCASLTKPQKKQNRAWFVCSMEGKKCQNWTKPKLCSRTLRLTCDLNNLLGLNNMSVFKCFFFLSFNAFSIFVFPEKHHKCKL